MPRVDRDFCISSYLAFRYVVCEDTEWVSGLKPQMPHFESSSKHKVKTAEEVLAVLKKIVSGIPRQNEVGILLSGGIDSAILASLLPKGTRAYTVRFISEEKGIDEVPNAEQVAQEAGLKHAVVEVGWQDFLDFSDLLMQFKKAPLHAAEVGLFQASKRAFQDGIKTLIVGNGADSTFGGLDKILSKDWTFDEFVERYTFLDPARAVKKPVLIRKPYETYRTGQNQIDVIGFLKVVHGLGIIQMFDNAIHSAGCRSVAPYEELILDAPLDMARIRRGESKYILRDVFKMLHPRFEIPPKVAFARPVDVWLKNWKGPQRSEFLEDLDMKSFSGEQKWLLYCLERFLNLLDKGPIKP